MLVKYRNVTIEGDGDTAVMLRKAVRHSLFVAKQSEPTQEEINAAVVEYDAEESDKADLSALGQQVANEVTYLTADIDYLQTVIPAIDTMTSTQVRTTVRGLAERVLRLEQENLAIIKAFRYLIRKTSQ